MDRIEPIISDVDFKVPLTLKEKIVLQKKIDYVKQEIKNYEMAVKVGKNPAFNAYSVTKINNLTTSLDELNSSSKV